MHDTGSPFDKLRDSDEINEDSITSSPAPIKMPATEPRKIAKKANNRASLPAPVIKISAKAAKVRN